MLKSPDETDPVIKVIGSLTPIISLKNCAVTHFCHNRKITTLLVLRHG